MILIALAFGLIVTAIVLRGKAAPLQLSGTFDYHGQPLHFAITWERVRP